MHLIMLEHIEAITLRTYSHSTPDSNYLSLFILEPGIKTSYNPLKL